MAKVHISLTSRAAPNAYGAMSDSAGHFSVARMPPGRYGTLAESTGYVHVADGAGVSLKEGQQLTDLKVKMARASMVTGRVVDQYGDPVPQTNVQIVPAPPAKMSAFAGVRHRGRWTYASAGR